MQKVIFTSILALAYFCAEAQERCGTVEYEKMLQQRNPIRENTDQFETWMKAKMLVKAKAFNSNRAEGTAYTVPIVVHVIHNGEPVGSGTNISDAQILSQVKVINDDFKRLNADTTKTPSEFQGVAGKFNITFVMAQQDPDGLATNGITRTKGTQTSWGISDNYTFKALSYWPAEEYLNIWVINLSGGLLGYTQLPVSTSLQGLQDASNDRLTDGVVVHYQAYGTTQVSGGGSFNLLSEYALGRTATHEIGHFFGLRHVWGDVNSCDPAVSTDYVADTPIQNTNYNGLCPTSTPVECGVDSMFDNYMNYTDDACMNIFSGDQVGRMDVIINSSPRRLSLLTSPGSQPPTSVANDLGIKSILAPGSTVCSGNLIPSINLHNYGSNTVTDAQIQFSINGVLTETKTVSSLGLTPNTDTTLDFSTISVNAGTTSTFLFKIINTNSGVDSNAANNSLSISTSVPSFALLPLSEPFNSTPTSRGWQIQNPDNLITWSNVALTGSNNAMYLNFYSYDNQGTPDYLITPVLDLSNPAAASLSFDYAYASYQGSNDRLRVLVSTTCDFGSPVEIFNKSGSTLATTASVNSSFVPTSSQWVTTTISLSQFIGQKIQIAFEGINDYGNNLYLDNVSVVNNLVTAVTLSNLVTPSPVSCLSSVAPVVRLTNSGNATIHSLVVDLYINNQHSTQTISGLQFAVGNTSNLPLSQVTFSAGNNTLAMAIKTVNGIQNASSTDSLFTNLIINPAVDVIPLRENFDGNFSAAWSIVSPSGGKVWTPVATNKSTSLVFNSFDNTVINEKTYVVSPVLDFSKTSKSSVFFETSYAARSTGSESLNVYSSTDCGETFDKLLFSSTGTDLANNLSSDVSWQPTKDSDWKKNYISLDSLSGKENIRLAFVATNGNGNNLYLDNIEFFTDDNPSPLPIDNLYSVYGGLSDPVKITFNLPDRQTVRVQAYDILGHVMSDNYLTETLNQTYTIEFPTGSNGLYIIRVQTATALGSTKVLIGY